MSKGWKIAISIILFIIFVVCIPFNVWYFYLLSKKDNHIVSYTFEIGTQTLSDGSSSKYFIEVEYFSNEDNSGREEFGIKFNYMLDENQTAFYSQGLQYVANENKSLSFVVGNNSRYNISQSYTNFFGWHYDYYDVYKSVRLGSEITFKPSFNVTKCGERYNYMSSDDYKTTVLSTNPISNDTMFKIQIGENLYGMKFKGAVNGSGFTQTYSKWMNTEYEQYWDLYDVDYFAAKVFSSVKSLKNGTQRALTFEFGDLFDYFEYNPETKKYDKKVDAAKSDTLITDVKSYYSILLNKSASGVQRANDSMFNMVESNSGFSISKAIPTDDYFVGRSVIDCTLENFTKVKITDTDIALKLKDSFIKDFELYNEKVRLNILIDLDELKNENFLGFTKDSGLNKFVIQNCRTKQTINGQIVYKVVAYD